MRRGALIQRRNERILTIIPTLLRRSKKPNQRGESSTDRDEDLRHDGDEHVLLLVERPRVESVGFATEREQRASGKTVFHQFGEGVR